LALLLAAYSLVSASPAHAQILGGSAVGGVDINAKGVLDNPTVQARAELRAARAAALQPIAGDLEKFTKQRKVSLRGLNAALAQLAEGKIDRLPDEVLFLAGLQQIQYVFVYPEQNDIVLVGPAEGWKIALDGDIVGKTTGKPVLMLDDLLVALRNAGAAEINCSIDPTPEGLKQLQTVAAGLRTIGDPNRTKQLIENALGPQVISVHGVAPTTHFARVLVAADYRMKRLAMGFEPVPVRKMPSFLQMVSGSGRGLSNMMPRWWLAPKAEPLVVDPDGLSWEIRSFGVQCLTEEDHLAKDGSKQRAGKASAMASQWANNFTANYDELAQKESIFGQLRNVMELAVVGALIHQEDMFGRAKLDAPQLASEQAVANLPAPQSVNSRATLMKKGRNWVITASGGVQIFPGKLAGNQQKADTLGSARTEAVASSDAWWWN
jgi:hypothetical protein